jgi:hypothetical protein
MDIMWPIFIASKKKKKNQAPPSHRNLKKEFKAFVLVEAPGTFKIFFFKSILPFGNPP